MFVPSMLNMADVMAESRFTEEQVFDLGLSNSIVFLVVVPLVGACRVPVNALSHFMAGADEYTADAMPEHYSGVLSGCWTIKRERLRILPASWGKWVTDVEEIQALCELCELQDAAPIEAPLMTVGASDGVEPDKAGPLPAEQGLSTKDIAQAFDGVNGWDFERWRKNLSASKWLHSARIAIGGAGGASSVWNPLMLAQLMHDDAKGEREKEKLMKVFNSRFTLNPALGPWRDDFNEYFATHCATD